MPTRASHDVPLFLWLGPLVLGVSGVILGLFPGLVASPIALAVTAATGTVSSTTLVLWHGFTITLALSALTLAGSVALFTYRQRLWQLAWPRTLHAERLYLRHPDGP